MTTLMQASNEWMTRPADERFTSLPELLAKVDHQKRRSIAKAVSSHSVRIAPSAADPRKGIQIETEKGVATPTNWSFNQLAQLAGAPAGYLRKLPAPIVADALNYGFRFNRNAEDMGILATQMDAEDANGDPTKFIQLRAATGVNYGRIWNADIVEALIHRFGDGVTGDFKVPGEFGKDVPITKANTTIYGSDRDMFVFLADEKNRLEIPNRRNGEAGSLARGFFVWNSEVGSQTVGIAMFLFDYVCCNRIVWGAEQYREIRLRHTVKAPDRWIEEVAPVLEDMSQSSAKPIEQTIRDAQQKKLDMDLDAFLNKRFTKSETVGIKAAHMDEEGRPIETIWDAVTGVTAYAKSIKNQDDRVTIERAGGSLLDLI